jgi:RNA polymerase primary sigma factor
MVQPLLQPTTGDLLGSLLEKADLQGYLIPEDVLEIFPWDTEDDDRLHALFLGLRRRGIEIISGEEEAEPPSEAEGGAPDIDILFTLEHISADDSVGLYLKEMSLVPLLSLEEVVGLAQRIETARLAKQELNRTNGRTAVQRKHELETTVRRASWRVSI